jgi:hypothetical protein
MGFCSKVLALVIPVLPLMANGPEGAVLDYRLKVRLRDETAVMETGFRVITTPPLITGNKIKRPRMGAWRIEPLALGGVLPSRAVLARALGLCYFSGPTDQVAALGTGIRLNRHWCRLWQVQPPAQVGAYVYLAEVAPNLLALAYLSANLPEGDIRSMEIHLARVSLGSRVAPAEEGTALLKTLQHWATPPHLPANAEGQMETEEIQ